MMSYICSSIEHAASISEEKLAGVLGNLLKHNALSLEILEFLRIKIRKCGLYEKSDLIKGAFQLMLKDGMTYHTNQRYKNVMKCEMMIFSNMLNLISLWDKGYPEFDGSKANYLKYNEFKLYLKGANLKGVDLKGADLRKANLEKADLSEANLSEANMRGANLSKACLQGANLQRINLREADLYQANLEGAKMKGADLYCADLREANLSQAELQGANLQQANLRNAKLSNANLNGAMIGEAQIDYLKNINLENVLVHLNDTEQIIDYNEYVERGR